MLLSQLTQRFNSTLNSSAKKGPGFVIPLGIAGIAIGAYYFYQNGQKMPVAAAVVQPSHPVLTNPNEWIDFKVFYVRGGG